MKPIDIYHGTSLEFANDIVGPPPNPKVNIGGGEFGVGLYFQTSRGNAGMRVSSRYPDWRVVVATYCDNVTHGLKIKQFDHKQSDKLRASIPKDRRKSHRCNRDIVIGTIQRQPDVIQYKFESVSAEERLRNEAHLRLL